MVSYFTFRGTNSHDRPASPAMCVFKTCTVSHACSSAFLGPRSCQRSAVLRSVPICLEMTEQQGSGGGACDSRVHEQMLLVDCRWGLLRLRCEEWAPERAASEMDIPAADRGCRLYVGKRAKTLPNHHIGLAGVHGHSEAMSLLTAALLPDGGRRAAHRTDCNTWDALLLMSGHPGLWCSTRCRWFVRIDQLPTPPQHSQCSKPLRRLAGWPPA
jgi:hypothetical protein